MYKAVDTDSHVWEWEGTFSDKYWDPRYRGRRPMVVVSDAMGNLSFMIDSISFPRIVGPSIAIGGNPVSKDGIPAPSIRRHLEQRPGKWNIETLESAEFRSAQGRLEQMDREEVAVEVNFPSMLLTWPLAHDPAIGCAIARAYNDWMADISGQAPDRLKWVTVIEPADVPWSVKEIERTKKMGSVAVMFLGTWGNRQITDPVYEPLWAAAAAADMPVAVHIGFNCPALDGMYNNAFDVISISFVFPLMLGYHAVFASGVLDRYPNLKVGFFENGARWVDFMSKRIAENCGKIEDRTTSQSRKSIVDRGAMDPATVGGTSVVRPVMYRSEGLPEDYIRDGRVFVNCEVDEHQLPFVVSEYGDRFLLFASDIPHGHRVADPVTKMMARTDLSEETKYRILVENGARFYGFPVPQQPQAAPKRSKVAV